MKKFNIFLFSGLLASFYGISQPVLTGSNTNPIIGETYQLVRDQTVPFTFATPGANQTWNYTNLLASTPMTTTASSAAGSVVPAASLKVEYGGGATFYYNTSSTELTQLASTAPGVEMIYSNPEITLKYPFQMGSTNTDTWKTTFVSGSPFIRTGTTTINGIGYGTLILPSGTYSNVLCVNLVQNYDDSTAGMQFVIYQNETQLFYKPGNHHPILGLSKITTNMMGNTSVINSYYYMNSGIVSSVEEVAQDVNLQVYPNPSQGSFTVSFSEKNKFSNVSFTLTDMLGKRVDFTSRQTGEVYNIESASLTSGVYRLAVYANTKKIAEKVVLVNQD
jgi:hypothetical protein